jgi:rRNA maturation endonuclease Nob1
MKQLVSKWSLHCTNPKCGYAFSRDGEPDAICQRCGGFVEVNEHITFIEVEENNNDLRGN